MAVDASPLLESKFHVPRRRHGVVARRRLEERLDVRRLPALTLVSAPAGFGKTTLLAEWLATVGRSAPVAWVSLDSGDNDPRVLWTYIVAAVRAAAAEVGQGAAALLEDGASSIDAVLVTLLNDLGRVGSEVVVVLDDYHLIESLEAHESIRFVLEHLPTNVHVVLASRADPPWPLAGLRARGALLELRGADLRFRADEAVAYLNGVMSLDLTDSEVEALQGRTEGWVAALQLVALSLHDRHDAAEFIAGFAGDDRFIVDYLVDEVLDHQTPEIRHFLLHTSILGRLTGPLCDAVTGLSTGKATLEALERGNLFVIPLDDRRAWYRYHHLFADVVAARLLDEEPDSVSELHRRASDWYEQHGERPAAIRHALAAETFARAADLIERAVPALCQARQEATLRRWFEALPPELFADRPVLSVGFIGARMAAGDIDGVEALLDDVERSLASREASPGELIVVDEAEFARLPGQTAMYRAALALLSGDVAATIAHAGRAVELMPASDRLGHGAAAALSGLAHWTLGDLSAAERRYAESVEWFEQAEHFADVLGCRRALADIQFARGRLGVAMQTLESGLELARAHGPLRGTADMHVGLSELFRERNDLAAARTHVQASAELDDLLALPQNAYRWRVALARLMQVEGDYIGALELLDDAEERYDTDYSPSVRPVPAIAARVQVARGDLSAARRWAASRDIRADDEITYLHEYEYLTLARLLLAEHGEDPAGEALDDTRALLDRLHTHAADGQRTGSVAEILALQALAHHAGGDTARAIAALDEALTTAAPDGYVRIFLDEGPAMIALLQTVARDGAAVEHARRLLAAGRTRSTESAAVKPTASGLVDELSGRELEVLRLLRSDLSGPDIARELMVSLNTMRTHTKSIYMKLGVNSRRSAVRRAAELGL